MAGRSPTPRPDRRSTLPLLLALAVLGAGLGLWLGGPADPAAAAGPCRLGDFVWHDRNGNALQDDFEEGVPGVTVTLLDADEEPVDVDPVITDAQGGYLFDDLACATYVVKFDTNSRDGGSLTGRQAGDDPARDSDPAQRGSDTRVGWTDPVVLTEDDPADLTIDAGILVDYEECSIGDFVWSDENENGRQDGGEPGLPGVTVRLLTGNGEPSGYDPVVSDDQGRYAFPEILCGEYVLEFRVPAGAEVTAAGRGDDRAKDSDVRLRPGAPSWAYARAVVGVGDFDPARRSDRTIDAGFVLPDAPPPTPAPTPPAPTPTAPPAPDPTTCRVGGLVWEDVDADGVRDDGEDAVPGVRVALLGEDGDVAARATTDDRGRYALAAECGTFRVRFSGLPAGYEFVQPEAGSTGPVTLRPGRSVARNAAIHRPTDELPATGASVPAAWAVGTALAALGGLLIMARRRRIG